MRQTLSKGAFAAAAATGILSLYGSPALADSEASGVTKDSGGALSGNTVQVPVDVPVNLCGNTVGVFAALNESFGNACRNTSHKSKGYGAEASAVSKGSYGVGSGNIVQVPIDVPLNACGNSVDGLAVFDEATKTSCHNGSYGGGHGHEDDDTSKPDEEKDREKPPAKDRPTPHDKTPDSPDSPRSPEKEGEKPSSTPGEKTVTPPQLAETGSEALVAASAASAALLAGGVLLYRRGRTTWSR
ncbi:chaplin [Streptomyces sp. NRRL S-455]|uniref:chaplin n=2 Tax=unclassified Streptomyces TaxID=2593676 RepID=UPI0004BEE97F|nr:chaplin [Streptomyces sp. NRRL S-455]